MKKWNRLSYKVSFMFLLGIGFCYAESNSGIDLNSKTLTVKSENKTIVWDADLGTEITSDDIKKLQAKGYSSKMLLALIDIYNIWLEDFADINLAKFKKILDEWITVDSLKDIFKLSDDTLAKIKDNKFIVDTLGLDFSNADIKSLWDKIKELNNATSKLIIATEENNQQWSWEEINRKNKEQWSWKEINRRNEEATKRNKEVNAILSWQ